MKTRESSLWNWLRRGLKDFSINTHLVRIENSAEIGTPDVNGCIYGNDFWVELKVATEMRDSMIKVSITSDQVMWLRSRSRAGGNSFLLIMVKDEHYLLNGGCALLLSMVDSPVSLGMIQRFTIVSFGATAHEVLITMADHA